MHEPEDVYKRQVFVFGVDEVGEGVSTGISCHILTGTSGGITFVIQRVG